MTEQIKDGFRIDLESVINRYSKENGSNTPDFILAQYLNDCLYAYDKAVRRRDEWYNGAKKAGRQIGESVGDQLERDAEKMREL